MISSILDCGIDGLRPRPFEPDPTSPNPPRRTCHANSSPTPETLTTTARSQCWPHRQPPSAAPWPAPPPDAHPTSTAPTTQAPHVVLPTTPTQARVVSCRNHIQPIANLLQDTPLALLVL